MNRLSRHPDEAFTLIELILVLMLIAVLTTLATPALRGFARRAALDDTAASLLALTQQAQTRAVHEAAPYRIVFSVDERRAWLEHIGDEGYEAVDTSVVEPVTWGASVTIISDVAQDGDGQFVIAFEPTGLVSPGRRRDRTGRPVRRIDLRRPDRKVPSGDHPRTPGAERGGGARCDA